MWDSLVTFTKGMLLGIIAILIAQLLLFYHWFLRDPVHTSHINTTLPSEEVESKENWPAGIVLDIKSSLDGGEAIDMLNLVLKRGYLMWRESILFRRKWYNFYIT